MQPRQHPQRGTRIRRSAAGLLACALSMLIVPVAAAEPLEDDPAGSAVIDHGWEHRSDLEFDSQHDLAAQPARPGPADTKWPPSRLQDLAGTAVDVAAADNASHQAQQDAYLTYLEQKAAAANAAEPADETGAESFGQPWLIGVGAVILVAAGSVAAAIVRSRRPEPLTPIQRDRDRVNA